MALYRVQCSCGVEEVPALSSELLPPTQAGGFPRITCDCGSQVEIVVTAPTQNKPRQYADFEKQHGEGFVSLEPGTAAHKRWRNDISEKQRERVSRAGFRNFDHMRADSRALAREKAVSEQRRGGVR
jgi:hypothetical protein